MPLLVREYKATDTPVATVATKTLITADPSPQMGRRTLCINSTVNAVVTVIWNFLDAFGNVYAMLTFTIPAGNVTPQQDFITASGAVTASGSAPTVTGGAYANLAAHCSNGETIQYSVTSPSSGTLQLDLVESEAY